jgi:acyl-coenzyme A synthetase/AMP-(fatty) acid ligase
MLIYPLLHNGTRIVTKENFSLEGFSSLVKKYRITHTFVSSEGARTMLRMSDNVNPKNFMSVRDCLCGGERLSKNVREYMRSIFRENIFNIAYGATEVENFLYRNNSKN